MAIAGGWGTVTLALETGRPDAAGLVTATIWLNAAGAQVYSLDLALAYSATVASAVLAENGPLAAGLASSANLNEPGLVRLALAGATPISDRGVVATVAFRLAEPAGANVRPRWLRGDVNEGRVPAQLIEGRLVLGPTYLPLVL